MFHLKCNKFWFLKLIYNLYNRLYESRISSGENVEKELRKMIVKTKTFTLKPIAPEEAVIQMELLGHDFFVFISSETGGTAVVYKRKDKNYGLIEPVV